MRSLTTSQLLRCILAAALVLSAIGLMVNGHVIEGVLCLLGGVLCLPILYKWLGIKSAEVQLLSPAVMLAVALFSYMVLSMVPSSFSVPLKTVYTQQASASVVTTTHTSASTAVTTSASRVLSTSVSVTTALTKVETYVQQADTTAAVLSVSENTTAAVTETDVPSTSVVTVVTVTTTAPTVTQAPTVGETVYRTPSGKRYHLSATCGGRNSYEVTYDEAIEAGLTPCKKCAQ